VTAVRRGEIWLVDFGEPVGREQSGRRPAVIVSADQLNTSPAGIVIVVPCTTARRSLPSHVELDRGTTGLDEVSYAKCEDIKAVSEDRLITHLGAAPLDAMDEISRVLRYLLEL
jgi:mRNA interferase MazF